MTRRETVLVVEDAESIRRGIVDALKFAGYRTQEAADGEQGLNLGLSAGVDAILLDLMLPYRNGFEILDRIRKARPTLPIIILTAKGAEEDKVRGLKSGADDYVVKPFSATELLARVEAVLRRSPARPTPVSQFDLAGRKVDIGRREVVLPDGTRRELSELEGRILSYLTSNSGRAVGRDELLRSVWGINAAGVTTRTVDMHIARLREKLSDDGKKPEIILTVRSKGYMIGTT